MSMRKIIFLLIVCGAVAVVLTTPQVRSAIRELLQVAKEDMGPGEGKKTIAGHIKVFVPRGDQYYHSAGCPRLETLNAVPTPLEEAKGLYRPCPECKPPK